MTAPAELTDVAGERTTPRDASTPPDVSSSGPSGAWVWLLLATPLLPWLVALPAGAFLLPLLAPLTLFPSFVARVRAGRYGAAWALGMGWAALLSAGVMALVHLAPDLAARGILNGEPYRQEMFGWIETGTGKEVTPASFLPEHALHLGVFLLLTYVSGGYLGLVLGALLMAYMSYFVGTFGVASGEPLLGALAAWVPWSVVRVAAFVLFGAVLARPLWVRRAWPFTSREARLLLLGAAGIVVDVAVKILLAPAYGIFLRGLLRE